MSTAAKERKIGVLLSYLIIAFRNIIGLLLIPFLVNHLGIEEYGIYGLVMSLAGYLIIIELGLANTAIRYFSKYSAEKDEQGASEFLGLMLMIYSCISVLVIIVGSFIWHAIPDLFSSTIKPAELELLRTAFLILLLNVVITLMSNSYTGIISSAEKFKIQKVFEIIIFCIRTAAVFALVYQGYGLITVVIIDASVNLLHALLKFVYVRFILSYRPVFKKPQPAHLKEVFVYTSFVGLNVIVNQVNWRVDNFIIASLTDSESLGVFNIGNQLVFAYIAFASAITNVFTPQMVKLVTLGKSAMELTQALIKIGRVQMLILGFVIAIFAAYGSMFIELFVSQKFKLAFWVALIPMLPFMFVLAQSSTNAVLQGLNKHKVRSWLLLATAIFNVVISILLVDSIGIVGASIGTALALFLGELVLVNIYLQRVIKLDMLLFYKRILVGNLPPIFLCLVFSLWLASHLQSSWAALIFGCFLSLFIYSASCYFWLLESEERLRVKGILNRFKRREL